MTLPDAAPDVKREIKDNPTTIMGQRQLTAGDVVAIREAWDTGRIRSLEALGAKYGVSVSTISAIVKRITWRDIANNIEEDEAA